MTLKKKLGWAMVAIPVVILFAGRVCAVFMLSTWEEIAAHAVALALFVVFAIGLWMVME